LSKSVRKNLQLRFSRDEVEKNLSEKGSREWLDKHSTLLGRSSNSELISVLYEIGRKYSNPKSTFCKKNGEDNKSELKRWLDEKTKGIWNATTAEEALKPGSSLDKVLFQRLLIILKVPFDAATGYIQKAYPLVSFAYNTNIVEEYCCMCGSVNGWDISVVKKLTEDINKLIPDASKIVNGWLDLLEPQNTIPIMERKLLIKNVDKYIKSLASQQVNQQAKDGITQILQNTYENVEKLLDGVNVSEAIEAFKYSSAYISQNVTTIDEQNNYRDYSPTATAFVPVEDEEYIKTNIKSAEQAYYRAKEKIRHFRDNRLTARYIIDGRFYRLKIDIFEEGVLDGIVDELYTLYKDTKHDTLTENLEECLFRNSENISRRLFIECLLLTAKKSPSIDYLNSVLCATVFEKKLDVYYLLDACIYEACKRAEREKKRAWELYKENYMSFISLPTHVLPRPSERVH